MQWSQQNSTFNMATYSTNEFRSGLKIIIDKDPYTIIDNEVVKPGKGQAFNRIKVKNLLSGRVIEKTYKSGESLPAADVMELEVTYLYSDNAYLNFMHPTTFEQYQISVEAAKDSVKWLKEQDLVTLTLFNDHPILVTPPNHVVLSVVDTEPGIKGDTAQGGSKLATLETGAEVRVPLFINIGDSLKIDSRTGSYISRG